MAVFIPAPGADRFGVTALAEAVSMLLSMPWGAALGQFGVVLALGGLVVISRIAGDLTLRS